jgi:hypothetical protein
MDDPLEAWYRLEARHRRTQERLTRAGATLERSFSVLDGAQRTLDAARQRLLDLRVLRERAAGATASPPAPDRAA